MSNLEGILEHSISDGVLVLEILDRERYLVNNILKVISVLSAEYNSPFKKRAIVLLGVHGDCDIVDYRGNSAQFTHVGSSLAVAKAMARRQAEYKLIVSPQRLPGQA